MDGRWEREGERKCRRKEGKKERGGVVQFYKFLGV